MKYPYYLLLFYCSCIHALEFHDGHIHYNDSVWSRLPAEQAMRYLKEEGIDRIIVSSTPAEGSERLYKVSPERVIPFIRPYRNYRDVLTWHYNPEIIEYIREKAGTGIYRGFGEFHMWIEHMEGSIVPEIMKIAAEQQWALSAHTDLETIEALIRMQPTVPVIWAHCGFYYPASVIRKLVEEYPTAYCEMSFYEKLTDRSNNLLPEWKSLMEDHPTRFMVGTDTFKEGRWGELQTLAENIVEWLEQLEPEARDLIARGNIDRLFPVP